MIINVVLAIFNLFPLPSLDGGRIAVGLLSDEYTGVGILAGIVNGKMCILGEPSQYVR